MILVDVENANGGPVRTSGQSRWTRRVLLKALGAVAGDQIVVACNGDRDSVLNVYAAWGTSARIVLGYGPDGADRALIEVMGENLPTRFDELVLVSGDGIFALPAATLAAQGLPTHVLAHPGRLSSALRLAATTVNPIVPNPTSAPDTKAA